MFRGDLKRRLRGGVARSAVAALFAGVLMCVVVPAPAAAAGLLTQSLSTSQQPVSNSAGEVEDRGTATETVVVKNLRGRTPDTVANDAKQWRSPYVAAALFAFGLVLPIMAVLLARPFRSSRRRSETAEAAAEGSATPIVDVFVDSARRAQILVGRQLALLDELRSTAKTPELLDNLGAASSVAEQLRRNVETVLLLAHAESTRRLAALTSLSDVVRGALAAVEDYERFELVFRHDPPVKGEFVLPTSHVVAELVMNASQFSERGSPIVASATATDSGVELRVVDSGAGMAEDELAVANARLAGVVSGQSSSHRVGLFLAGRLAEHIGASVRLSRGSNGGTVATVELPMSFFAGVSPGDPEAGRDADAVPAAVEKTPDAAPVPAAVETARGAVPVPAAVAAAPRVQAPRPPAAPASEPMPGAQVQPPVSPPADFPGAEPVKPASPSDLAGGVDPDRDPVPAMVAAMSQTALPGTTDAASADDAAPARPRVIKSHRAQRQPTRRLFQRRQRKSAPDESAGGERRTAPHDRRAPTPPPIDEPPVLPPRAEPVGPRPLADGNPALQEFAALMASHASLPPVGDATDVGPDIVAVRKTAPAAKTERPEPPEPQAPASPAAQASASAAVDILPGHSRMRRFLKRRDKSTGTTAAPDPAATGKAPTSEED